MRTLAPWSTGSSGPFAGGKAPPPYPPAVCRTTRRSLWLPSLNFWPPIMHPADGWNWQPRFGSHVLTVHGSPPCDGLQLCMALGQEYAHNRPVRLAAAPGNEREPSCGMRVTAAPGAGEYVCPMHPEVVREHPGSCPVCGMALEPRAVSAEG